MDIDRIKWGFFWVIKIIYSPVLTYKSLLHSVDYGDTNRDRDVKICISGCVFSGLR